NFRTGKGKYVWPNGVCYEGDFVKGSIKGNGKKIYTDGYVYVGQFKDDDRHGKGVLTAPDGTDVEYYYENDKIVCKAAEATDEIITRIYGTTPPITTAKPRTEKQATVAPEVKKTKPVTPIVEAKASSDDIEFWNKLVDVKSNQKRKEEILASHPIVVIPEGTKRIPGYLFDKSLNLKGVRFNSDIAEIGMGDFRGCKNLGPVVVIPKGVKKIYSYAFENCSSLKKVVLPNNIIIDRLAFVDSGITEVEFETEPPRGVVLSYGAFKHCDKHMTKEMKEKIKSIGSGAFK
ncbi:MAG: leucine-rich repeat protein, partial [Clostridia bacterium]|nr:leucine-rich repeat protein [Clostridia bacterium]